MNINIDEVVDKIVEKQNIETQLQTQKKLKNRLQKKGTLKFRTEISITEKEIINLNKQLTIYINEIDAYMEELVSVIKQKKNAITITVGNYKGGAGKTSNTVNLAHVFANYGLRVLVGDMDAQTNATKVLMLTKSLEYPDEVISIDKTIMKGVQEESFEGIPVSIVPNLDLLPTSIEFQDFSKHIFKKSLSDEDSDFTIDRLLQPLKKDYDIILLDIPPLNIEVTRNAVCTSDYVIVSLQTQERSLGGAEDFEKELQKMVDKYGIKVEILGVLAVLLKNKRKSDEFIVEKATEIFGAENLYKQVIPQMDRVPSQDLIGLSVVDRHDKAVYDVYKDVAIETLERIYYFEKLL